jgi:hypothetical protein
MKSIVFPLGPCVRYNPLSAVPGIVLIPDAKRKLGLSYSQLKRTHHRGNEWVLFFARHRVTLEGLRLLELHTLLTQHQIIEIRAILPSEVARVNLRDPLVTGISIEPSSPSEHAAV